MHRLTSSRCAEKKTLQLVHASQQWKKSARKFPVYSKQAYLDKSRVVFWASKWKTIVKTDNRLNNMSGVNKHSVCWSIFIGVIFSARCYTLPKIKRKILAREVSGFCDVTMPLLVFLRKKRGKALYWCPWAYLLLFEGSCYLDQDPEYCPAGVWIPDLPLGSWILN